MNAQVTLACLEIARTWWQTIIAIVKKVGREKSATRVWLACSFKSFNYIDWIKIIRKYERMNGKAWFMLIADIDNCLVEPCKNGGVCKDLRAAFSCTCAPGYTGDTCETGDNFVQDLWINALQSSQYNIRFSH